MFAYILLLYLLRHLHEGSSVIDAPCKLDVGFSCFSCYCVISTFSSLVIQYPADSNADGPTSTPAPPVALRLLGRKGIALLSIALLVIFGTTLYFGIMMPCLELSLNSASLLQPNGPLPQVAGAIIESLHLTDLVNAKVPIADCTRAMVRYAITLGEANCILAMVMLLVFAIGLTCLDMLVLTLAALQVGCCSDERREAKDSAGCFHRRAMAVAEVVGKISMLDVCIMGVIVMTCAASIYKRMGVVFQLGPGIVPLIAAEVVHYITYQIVSGVAQHLEDIQHSISKHT